MVRSRIYGRLENGGSCGEVADRAAAAVVTAALQLWHDNYVWPSKQIFRYHMRFNNDLSMAKLTTDHYFLPHPEEVRVLRRGVCF